MTRKTKDEKLKNSINVRFTDAQFEALKASCPVSEDFAAYIRRMALTGAKLSGPDHLRKAVAFIIGALSTDYTPDEVLPLFDEFVAPETEGQSNGALTQ